MLKESVNEPWTILHQGQSPCRGGEGSKGCETLMCSPEHRVSLPSLRVSHAVVMQANSGNNCVFCAMKTGHTTRLIGKLLP